MEIPASESFQPIRVRRTVEDIAVYPGSNVPVGQPQALGPPDATMGLNDAQQSLVSVGRSPQTMNSAGGDSGGQTISPQKKELREEIEFLRRAMVETRAQAMEQAEHIVAQQRFGFEQAAQNYEAQARDINEAEMAKQRASLERNFTGSVLQAQQEAQRELDFQKRKILQEAEQAVLEGKNQTLSEAEQAFSVQQTAMQEQYGAAMKQAEEHVLAEKRKVQEVLEQYQESERRVNLMSEHLQQQVNVQESNFSNQNLQTESLMHALKLSEQRELALQQHQGDSSSLAQELKMQNQRMVDMQEQYNILHYEYSSTVNEAQRQRDLQEKQMKNVEMQMEKLQQHLLQAQQQQEERKKIAEGDLRDQGAKAPAVHDISTPPVTRSILDLNFKEEETSVFIPFGNPSSKPAAADENKKTEGVPKGSSEKSPPSSPVPNETLTKTKEADSIKFEAFPSAVQFRYWKLNFMKKVAASSGRPQEAFAWISKVQNSSFDELEDCEGFLTLDAKIASALFDILTGEFKRRVQNLEEKASRLGKMMTGRQLAWLIYDKMRTSEADGSLLEITDLINVELKGDNLPALINDWDAALEGQSHEPSEAIKEGLFRKQLERSHQLTAAMALINQDVTQRGEKRSYDRLYQMVLLHIEHKNKVKNRNDLASKSGRFGAPATDPQKASKGKKGDCRQYIKKGSCSRGDECPFIHDDDKANARRGRPRQRTTPRKDRKDSRSSKSSRGNSSGSQSSSKSRKSGGGKPRYASPGRPADNKKKLTGTSPSGKKDRPPCRQHQQGKCSRGKECDYWHTPPCRFHKQGTCRAGDKCVFLHKDPPAAALTDSGSDSGKSAQSKKEKKEKKTKKDKKEKEGQAEIAMCKNEDSYPGCGAFVCSNNQSSNGGRKPSELPLNQ